MTIFLDLDNTLYDQCGPFYAAFSEFFGGREDSRMPEACLHYAIRSKESFYACERGEMTQREMHIYRLQKGLEDTGISVSEEEAEALHTLYEYHQQHISPDMRTVEFLASCKTAGLSLGILSNGPGAHQRRKLAVLGVEQYFKPELIVISEEIGVAKPDCGIFEAARAHAGVPASELIMIGDSLENDILPARTLGWTAIHYLKDPKQWAEILRQICGQCRSKKNLPF